MIFLHGQCVRVTQEGYHTLRRGDEGTAVEAADEQTHLPLIRNLYREHYVS